MKHGQAIFLINNNSVKDVFKSGRVAKQLEVTDLGWEKHQGEGRGAQGAGRSKEIGLRSVPFSAEKLEKETYVHSVWSLD